jgi:hypothetical protein
MATQQGRLARLRHPLAAILGVAGILVGSIAAFGVPATAAAGDLVQTISLDCETTVPRASGPPSVNPFVWPAQFTLSATRPAGSTTVTVIAKVSDMPGISPAQMFDYPASGELMLTFGGATTRLAVPAGATVSNGGSNEPVPVPDFRGTLTSSASSLDTVLTSFKLVILAITTECTPTSSGVLGSLVPVEGTPPPLPSDEPTATTTTSSTATPTPAETAAGSDSGKPAKGTADFTCKLNINPDPFAWKPTVSVAGYRKKASDPVSLVATMTDLPGKAPVPIAGSMDFTLDLHVGGKATRLKSTGNVDAAPFADVPVTDLTGEVDVDGDELAVTVSGFTFDFPSAAVGAECEASSTSLGKLKVGSEPIASDTDPSSGSTTTTGGSTLPKTGGGDSLPVVALWALALTLLGVAGLLCVPRTRRQH